MGRIHAFELEDLAWFPRVLREAGMAFLRFASERLGQARAMQPVIEEALARSGDERIVDLCSGGGGPIVSIARELRRSGRDVRVTLTDLYPDGNARTGVTDDGIDYEPSSVDATSVPASLAGVRTMFNAFHHFRPAQATAILRDAVEDRRPIVVIEVLQRRLLATLGVALVPVFTLLVLPFLRPFRWSWVPLTYVLPVIPLFIWWDGTISSLRAYNPNDVERLIEAADPERAFEWDVRDLKIAGQPFPGLAVIGIPKRVE